MTKRGQLLAAAFVVAVGLLLSGCGHMRLVVAELGVPRAEQPNASFDKQLLALCSVGQPVLAEQQRCVETQLQRIGVKPEEAAKRALEALAASVEGVKR